jgi:hypothetical protein
MNDVLGILDSEFATVALSIDEHGNGPRLRIEDLRTGFVGYLDPLQLETLAWLPGGELNRFLDPSFHRWRETSGDTGRPEADEHAGPPPPGRGYRPRRTSSSPP